MKNPSKERVTFIACSNASGNPTLPLTLGVPSQVSKSSLFQAF